MTLPRQTIGVRGRSSGRQLAAVVAAVAAGMALAACKATAPPVPGNPVIAFTLDSVVSEGDTIHGDVVATSDHDLTSLQIVVYDTAGTDSLPKRVSGGTSIGAARFDDKFTWKLRHILAGQHVQFSAIAYDFFGDSTIVFDSTLVKP